MKHFLVSTLLFMSAIASWSQERSKPVLITVTSSITDNMEGQELTLIHTDYSLTYETLKLNTSSQCLVKVYPGNHRVTVDRNGYEVATQSFFASDDTDTLKVNITLSEKVRKPFALKARYEHNAYGGNNNVYLTWNTEEPAFEDDFESYDAFSTTFGNWTGIDGDKLSAAPLTGDYPNRGVQQYAQIINPLTVEPTWWYEYPILRPYSGKQYVGFIRTNSGATNDDWLISPIITPGTANILSFMAKAADIYKEKFKVYITTKLDNPQPSDFIRLDKDNYESADHKGWKEYNYDISSFAGKQIKFAIRYVGNANDGGAFMLMLDDVYVGPVNENYASAKSRRLKKSPANPNETFEITQNGKIIATTSCYDMDILNIPNGNYIFGVKAKYIATETEEVTTEVDIPTDIYSHVFFNVTANSLLSANGKNIQLINATTGETYSLYVYDNKAEMLSLPFGTYIINIAEDAFNKYQESITIHGDTTIKIELTDHIVDPYNITAEISEDSHGGTAILTWNQELGFTDSFEDYDDFASGSFGGWKTIDVDQMPVYPIGLGSTSNIVSFPGSGTASNPTAIPPMVFNPYKTSPAMAPTDEAIMAPTGEKTIIFFSPQQGKADKWLISPEIKVFANYEFSCAAKSYSSYYPETFEFCVSTEGDQPENFTAVSVAENMPSEQWTRYSTPLDAYEGKTIRIGVHYTSYDTFFAQLDDFSVGDADGETTITNYGNIDHFNIYLDNILVGKAEESSYVLKSLTEGTHTIGIQAVYKNTESAIINYVINVILNPDGINEISSDKDGASCGFANYSYNLAGQRVGNGYHGILINNGHKFVK